MLTWAFPRLASIRVMHIPGVTNVGADFLSRHRPPSGEWKFNPEVVEMIWQWFGRVDLFASAALTQCPPLFLTSRSIQSSGEGCSSPRLARSVTICLSPYTIDLGNCSQSRSGTPQATTSSAKLARETSLIGVGSKECPQMCVLSPWCYGFCNLYWKRIGQLLP